jgi:hypothetical protein
MSMPKINCEFYENHSTTLLSTFLGKVAMGQQQLTGKNMTNISVDIISLIT